LIEAEAGAVIWGTLHL